MIGGQALRQLGSTRWTEDTDYLVYDERVDEVFIHDRENNVDYCNAAKHPLFRKIWETQQGNEGPLASPQALLELKLFAWVNHLVNGFLKKAVADESDIKFLMLEFPQLVESKCTVWHVTTGQAGEIKKFLADFRKLRDNANS